MRLLTMLGVRAPRAIQRRIRNVRVLQYNYFSSDANEKSEDVLYDLIISGGGMVGCSMAAALACEPMFKGKKVLLLEAAADKRMDKLPEVYRSRTCALSASSVQLLEKFGAWKNICEMRVKPVDHMQVWDSCSNSMITFHKDMAADKPLAFIAENDVIMTGISDSLRALNSEVVQVRYNSRVQGYKLPESAEGSTRQANDSDSENQWAQVIMDNGQTLRTRLLIGADGVNSLVRQTADIHHIKWDYGQSAVVATLTLAENGDNTTAWQRFLPSGPIALLPLTNEHSCLIWSTSHVHAKQLSQMSADSLVDAINHAFQTDDWKDATAVSVGQLVHSMTSQFGLRSLNHMDRRPRLAPTVVGVAMETMGSFPLGLGHATYYVKSRVALIGDAAHRVHPLAGQGVNLGFSDVSSLVRHLVNALEIGSDIGSVDHLMSYETERQRIVVPIMAGIDGLNRIYSNQNPLLVLFRSVGCNTLQSLSPVKDLMMKIAAN